MSRISTIQWTVFTALGLATGLMAGVLLGMPLGQILNAMIVTAAVTCLAGTILGGFQAISLRRVLRRPIWWIVATVIGMGLGLAAAVVTVEQTGILLTGHRPQLAHLTTFYRAISFIALGLVAARFSAPRNRWCFGGSCRQSSNGCRRLRSASPSRFPPAHWRWICPDCACRRRWARSRS
jgi:hypothetical protein